MEPRTTGMLSLLFAIACCAEAALGMPKAAENEAAQVGHGADVARPKLSAKPAKPQAGGKNGASARANRTGAANPQRGAKAQHASVSILPSTLC